MKKYHLKINDNNYQVEVLSVEGNMAKVIVNDEPYEVMLDDKAVNDDSPARIVEEILRESKPAKSAAPATNNNKPAQPASGTSAVKSPLPGKILDIYVKIGDKIAVGQNIICLEAMKMENNIHSEKAGTVTAINVQKGDTVLEGDKLVEIG